MIIFIQKSWLHMSIAGKNVYWYAVDQQWCNSYSHIAWKALLLHCYGENEKPENRKKPAILRTKYMASKVCVERLLFYFSLGTLHNNDHKCWYFNMLLRLCTLHTILVFIRRHLYQHFKGKRWCSYVNKLHGLVVSENLQEEEGHWPKHCRLVMRQVRMRAILMT